MKLVVRPLTPEPWPFLEDLFGPHGASNGCWCIYWQIGSAYSRRPCEKNRTAFHRIVNRARAPALEDYPVDARSPSSSANLYTGVATTLERADFDTVARPAPHRPIMRHDLKALAK